MSLIPKKLIRINIISLYKSKIYGDLFSFMSCILGVLNFVKVMVPSEVCEDIPDQADCFAPTRNIARRSCRTVPSTLQKEVCRSRPSPCPDVCNEEEVTRCHPPPGCSPIGQRCREKTKRVCRQVPHPVCALVRNTRRARQLRFDNIRQSDYSDNYAEKSDAEDEDIIVHQLDGKLTGNDLVDQEKRFFRVQPKF